MSKTKTEIAVEKLGHVSLDTTSGYLHESTQVQSPLDALMASRQISIPTAQPA